MTDDIAYAAFVTGFLACVYFVVRMLVSTRAGSNRAVRTMRRHTLALGASLGTLLGLAVAVRVFGDYPYRREAIATAAVVLAATLVQRCWIFEHERREARRNQRQHIYGTREGTQ